MASLPGNPSENQYNSKNRLKSVSWSVGATLQTQGYQHNALGQRVVKSRLTGAAPGSSLADAALYDYDASGQLVGEYTSSNQLVQEIIWLGDIPLATLRPKAGQALVVIGASGSPITPQSIDSYYVHADHLNTPRLVTRPSDNKALWRWDNNEPFGNNAPNENPSRLTGTPAATTFTLNLRFPGQQWDKETGLHYNYFRDYAPGLGRYVQSDPIGLAGGLSTYSYVKGSPVSYVDPLGHVRKGGQSGEWWEFTDRNFQRWFHQCIKDSGDADANRAELANAYKQWVEYGRPNGKDGCGGPPPPPPVPTETCGDTCKTTATVVAAGTTAYFIYRCVRLGPSLFPPLWATIPANLAMP